MSECGIGAIINKTNNKRFIFKSTDLDLRKDNYFIQLENNCHFNEELQSDWNKLGSENFAFETREITLNDDMELTSRFIHHINICSDIYNIFDSKKLFKHELTSKIEILTNKLYLKVGKNEFNANFQNKLDELKLDHSDGENFILSMLNLIKSDEINYYNFDFKFNEMLNQISQNKMENIQRNKKEKLLTYLHSVLGKNTNSQVFTQMLENHHLEADAGLSIRIEIEDMINSNKVNSAFEIDEALDKILKREQGIKLQNQTDKQMALKKLYSITGDYVLKVSFISKLKSLDLSYEDGNLIKKDIERKIELNEIAFAQVEAEVEKSLKDKVTFIQNRKQSKKSQLLSLIHDIIGDESVNDDFKNRLKQHDLHENIAFQIKNNLNDQIEKDSIADSNDLKLKIDKLILQKEKEDVEVRLNDLSKNEIDGILKMNSINTTIPFKATKIAKLLSIVPLNVLKQNLNSLGYTIDVSFVDNPNVIFCSNCGFKNSSDSLFCSECGHKLND